MFIYINEYKGGTEEEAHCIYDSFHELINSVKKRIPSNNNNSNSKNIARKSIPKSCLKFASNFKNNNGDNEFDCVVTHKSKTIGLDSQSDV